MPTKIRQRNREVRENLGRYNCVGCDYDYDNDNDNDNGAKIGRQ